MVEFDEKTSEFETYDGLKLFYQTWYPKTKKTNIVFIGIHGAAVYSSNLDNFGEYFASKGYPVFAYDRRGFGHCDEKIRGHIDDYRVYINDTIAFIEYLKEQENPEKIVLFGHSMGAIHPIIIAIEKPGLVDYIISSSPAFVLKSKDILSPFRKPLAYTMAAIVPKLKTSNFLVPKKLCKDQERAKSRLEDPLYTKKCTAKWVKSLFDVQKQAKKLLPKLTTPTFFLVAGNDNEISSKSTIKLFERIEDKRNIKIKIYEDHFHEHFNELKENREQLFHDIETFLNID